VKSLVAFAFVFILFLGGNVWGADEQKPRSVDTQSERPFGGPPNRAPRDMSDRCVAGETTCILETKRKLGTECNCGPEGSPQLRGRIVF
jgi:hypothetical protein